MKGFLSSISKKLPVSQYAIKAYKAVMLGVFLYALVVILYAAATKVIFPETEWLNELFDRPESPTDFAVSYVASAMDNIGFFFITGLLIFGFSMKRPEDGDFETKISYLFPILNKTDSAKQYAMSEINRIACISPKSEISVILESYDEQREAFKVRNEYQCHLKNLHNNFVYKDELNIGVRVDDFEGEDESLVNGIYGGLVRIRLITGLNESESTSIIEEPIPMEKPSFHHPVKIEIEPNGQAIYDSTHWVWNRFKSPSTAGVGRFTEEFIYKITNMTGMDLLIYEPSDSGTSIELNNHDTHTIIKKEITPRDKISYIIKIKGNEDKQRQPKTAQDKTS